ncbi:MAG: DNA polymerase/3'-5' exonuclease PolX [Thermoanaerobaculia bacterium]
MTDPRLVARALEDIARFLEVGEGNKFKARAYANAAKTVERLDLPVDDLIAAGTLESTPGIGKGTGAVIREIAATGKSSLLEELRAKYPEGLLRMLKIPGLGASKLAVLHRELGIGSVEELEQACRSGKLREVRGFGPRAEQKILAGIEELATVGERILLPIGMRIADALIERIAPLGAIEKVEVAGEVRRRLETIDRVDLCVAAGDAGAAMEAIRSIAMLSEFAPESDAVLRARGSGGVPVRIRFCLPEELGLTLMVETGSEEFVAALAARAAAAKADLAGGGFATEEEVFRRAGVPPVPPELRETDAYVRAKPPRRLIEPGDLRGAFHVHTTYSDGKATLWEMLDASREGNLEYVGISDHSKAAYYARGLDVDRLDEQQGEIDHYRETFAPLRIFKGTEADILADGSIDYGREVLARFDFVIASVHSRFGMSREEMTDRIVRALSDPFVTFLGHPTGRLLLSRPGYHLDFDRIFDAAAEHGVIVEINGNPHRLDLDWRLIGRALDRGVLFSINPDAHSTEEMKNVLAGVRVARKGALEPKHVFNTWPVEKVVAYLEERKTARRRRAGR